jgi:Tol biopolymer transport system component
MASRLVRSTLMTVAFTAWSSAVPAQGGGAFREVATVGRFESTGWVAAAPDGHSVLVAVDTTLLLVDVSSGRTSVIARGRYRRISLSHERTHIAFDRSGANGPEIWVARVDLQHGVVDSARRLSADRGYAPVFSPDGRTIAFSRVYATAESLAVVALADGAARTLPAGGSDLAAVGWSPDGNSVYFAAARDPRANAFPVFRLTIADGTVIPVLAQNFLFRARLSPDGSYILYAPTPEASGIARSNGEPVSMIPIEQMGAGREISEPEWVGPTGAFAVTSIVQPRMLIALDVASGRSTQLSDGAEWAGASAISHDNKRVAAIMAKDGPARLSVIDSWGTGMQTFRTRRPVAPRETGNAVPRWSPDDRFIAVPTGSAARPGSHPNATGVDVIELATSRVITLDIDHDLSRLVWSPDSRAIRYVHSQGLDTTDQRPMQVREAALQGGNKLVQELPRSAGATVFQDFNHVYSRNDGTLIDIRDGTIRDLVPLSAFPQPWGAPAVPCFSPSGEWMAQPTSAARSGPYNRVMLVAVRTGVRRILNAGLERTMVEGVKCHPDNEHLIVTGFDSTGASRAVLLSIADGTRRTIADVDYDLEGALQFAVAPDGKTLVVSRRRPPLPLKLFLFESTKK